MSLFLLQAVLSETLAALRRNAPTLLTFAGILLLGWIVARFAASWSRSWTARLLDRVGQRQAVGEALHRAGVETTVPRVIGFAVFWVIFLVFGATAVERLGLTAITDSLSQVVFYLPNAVAAVLVVLAGLIGGALARGVVARNAAAAGVPRGDIVARTVQATVVTIACIVALEQVGVSGRLLVVLVAIVVGTAFFGTALAFGLGARTAVSNIVASHYIAQNYRVGQRIRIGATEGRIVRTTPTAVILDAAEGQVMVPAHRFTEEQSVLLEDRV